MDSSKRYELEKTKVPTDSSDKEVSVRFECNHYGGSVLLVAYTIRTCANGVFENCTQLKTVLNIDKLSSQSKGAFAKEENGK